MAWSEQSSSSSAGNYVAYPTVYPVNNNPDFPGGGIILKFAIPVGIADGDVVALTVVRSVVMNRGSSYALSEPPAPWAGMAMTTKFPCITGSSAQQDLASYGADLVTEQQTCEMQTWVFQITDPVTHLTLTNWMINVDWDPGTGANAWSNATDDIAYIWGGYTVFRPDSNPTWPLQGQTGKRGCGYISFPHTGMVPIDTANVYIHTAANRSIDVPIMAHISTGWTESWTKEGSIGDYMLAVQYAFGTRPIYDADWQVPDGVGGFYTGVTGADGTGGVAGSMYVSLLQYDPATPPVTIDEPATSCLLHIPHHRWLEGGKDRAAIKQVEQNWHEFESWVVKLLTDDSCRPCSDYVAPPA